MKSPRLNAPGDQTTEAASAPEAETTGLPGLQTWRSVYALVLGIFLLWVALLAGLTQLSS